MERQFNGYWTTNGFSASYGFVAGMTRDELIRKLADLAKCPEGYSLVASCRYRIVDGGRPPFKQGPGSPDLVDGTVLWEGTIEDAQHAAEEAGN